MNTFRLLVRNLFYHWRGNLAVLLGMTLGAAVLTGALFVGDSLRGSLRGLALEQLGWVDHALIANRFFRADLADEVSAQRSTPVLLLQGGVRALTDVKSPPHATGVTIFGVRQDFWADAPPGGLASDFWQRGKGVVLNQTLATELQVKQGDKVALLVTRNDEMPREHLLGKRKAHDVVQTLRLDVAAILPDVGMARFSLKPSPVPPRNAFVPLAYLGEQLGLAGKANVLLATRPQDEVKKALTFADWGYRLETPADRARDFFDFLAGRASPMPVTGAAAAGVARDAETLRYKQWLGRVPDPLAETADKKDLSFGMIRHFFEEERPYVSLRSNRGILEAAVERRMAEIAPPPKNWVEAVLQKHIGLPVLVYLADAIQAGKGEAPYAIVAAVPFLPKLDPPRLEGDQAWLTQWPGSTLDHEATHATVRYYVTGPNNDPVLKTHVFEVQRDLKIAGFFDDPYWTPPYPGITDKVKIGDWENPPFPFDRKRLSDADEQFWKRYKTTPRMYVSLERGQELWGTRFGKLTSYRVYLPMKPDERDFVALAREVESELLAGLNPEAGGFVFQDIKAQALRAGGGSTDFGLYFLYFSFFIIVAALLLVGLLVRLNLERRAQEMGLLLATGWSHRKVRGLLLGEGAVLSLLGAAIGIAGALLYTDLLLRYLRANWPAEDGLSFLTLHTSFLSMAIGFGAAVAAGLLTLLWATRVLSKLAPKTLLAGAPAFTQTQASSRGGWSPWVMWISLVVAAPVHVIGWFVQGHGGKAISFFFSGALLLTAAIAFCWQRLGRQRDVSDPQPSLTLLALRNAGRYRLRSVLTLGLLASATFLIVAVESFHKETGDDFYRKDHGSGGFPLVAETDVPIFEDLNEAKTWRELTNDEDLQKRLTGADYFAFRVRLGDDASCLNLYQPLRPRLLGAGAAFRARGGFAFASSLAETDEEKANPWKLLETKREVGVLPAITDANTATWILKVGLGDVIEVPSDGGSPVKLRIVGLLRESIFQSELLLADEDFTQAFPHQEGFSFFLVQPRNADSVTQMLAEAKELQAALSEVLADQGFRVQTTRERVQAYLAVENTYLATFQALGGLGLLLGAVGLAIVLLRGVWERRGELALLQALGFRKGALAWLVLAENLFLLALGLAIGTLAALLSVAPHLLQSGGGLLWMRVLILLGLVAAVGLVSGLLAVGASLRTPVLAGLRRE